MHYFVFFCALDHILKIFYKIRYILEELYVAVIWITSRLIIYIDQLNRGMECPRRTQPMSTLIVHTSFSIYKHMQRREKFKRGFLNALWLDQHIWLLATYLCWYISCYTANNTNIAQSPVKCICINVKQISAHLSLVKKNCMYTLISYWFVE